MVKFLWLGKPYVVIGDTTLRRVHFSQHIKFVLNSLKYLNSCNVFSCVIKISFVTENDY